MKARFTILAALSVFTVLIATPAHLHGLEPGQAAQHDHSAAADTPDHATVPGAQGNMMAAMMASDAKLDELLKKVNAAKGTEKSDAMAELLTALVQEHKTMHASMMTNMMSMMNMMGGMSGHGDSAPTMPKK